MAKPATISLLALTPGPPAYTIMPRSGNIYGNRLTCDGVDVARLIQERLAATPVSLGGGGRPPLPAPRNLRIVTVP